MNLLFDRYKEPTVLADQEPTVLADQEPTTTTATTAATAHIP